MNLLETSGKIDEAVEKILRERYYVKKKNGELETWEELCDRVSTVLKAQTPFDRKYSKESLQVALQNREIMFGTPTLMNAGARLGMLSSCFIFSIKDNLDDIFRVASCSAKTFKHGGGIGYDFSDLRPEGANVDSTGGTSSGPLSFMSVIDKIGEVVKSGGLRKAAIMSTMRIDHPDIERFINIKREEHELNNMNLSVTITDEFMEALKNNTSFDLKFKGKVYKTVDAASLWNSIVDASWKSAEPGVIFIDKVNKYNTTPEYGPITHPNPCSEFFQVSWNSCNLGSINLMSCFKDKEFDYAKLSYLTRLLTTALNKSIQVNNFPIPDIERVTKALRPIGIGVFGLANVLIKAKLRYGSAEACALLEDILNVINRESIDLSAEYASVYGSYDKYSFDNVRFLHERKDKSDWISVIEKVKKFGLYNCLTTTLMPTGTVSILAGQGESNGIEPLYSDTVTRKFVNKAGALEDMIVKAPAIECWLEENPTKSDKELPDYMVTKDDLTALDHINMLAAAQRHCQTGVSKTVNFPHSATREDISNAMMLAYDMDCKSVSIYRDGSRSVQILNSDISIEEVSSSIEYKTPAANNRSIWFVVQRQKNGKVIGILPKDSAGCLITAGPEASKCQLINAILTNGSPIEAILHILQQSTLEVGDLSDVIYKVLRDAAFEQSIIAMKKVNEVEKSAEFMSCPTGVCSL